MKNELLFLAPYPTAETIKDGMFSRINAIDSFFKDRARIYLNTSFKRFCKKNVRKEGNVHVYELNVFVHFFIICKILFSSKLVYSHSINGFRSLWPFILFYNGTIILDAHGVVPEEILYYYNNKKLSNYMLFIEKIVFKRAKHIICVTHAMKDYFSLKYKHFKGVFHIYNILPENLKPFSHDERQISASPVNIIYSGGIAGWQNIDLMLNVIKKNQTNNIKYTILTGSKEYIENKLTQYDIDYVEVKSVSPDELGVYYQNSDYAFILRDDTIVNNVANPTKLVEYLFYGIVPIVLSPNIGDYLGYGYDYLMLEDFDTNISKPFKRSEKNIQIAKSLIDNNKLVDIRGLIVSEICNKN